MLNYGSLWTLDHDDGSSWYDDYQNVHLYSGTKHSTFHNGGHSKHIYENLMLFPDISSGKFEGQVNCAEGYGYDEVWRNNTCAMLHLSTPYQEACPPAYGPIYGDFFKSSRPIRILI